MLGRMWSDVKVKGCMAKWLSPGIPWISGWKGASSKRIFSSELKDGSGLGFALGNEQTDMSGEWQEGSGAGQLEGARW